MYVCMYVFTILLNWAAYKTEHFKTDLKEIYIQMRTVIAQFLLKFGTEEGQVEIR